MERARQQTEARKTNAHSQETYTTGVESLTLLKPKRIGSEMSTSEHRLTSQV